MIAGRLTKYQRLLEESGRNMCSQRILSQLAFLLELSEAQQGKFDNTILPQIERLYDAFNRDGAITHTNSLQVEKDLSLLGTEAKKYRISCILQPKITIPASSDPRYYIKEVRHALHMLETFKEIKYFEPRTTVYRLLETYQPLLLTRIKEMVKLGRWEVGITSWGGMEPELQSGEEALSHLMENRKYLAELLEIPPKTISTYFQIQGYHTTPHLISVLSGCDVPYIYNYKAKTQNYQALEGTDNGRIFQLDSVENLKEDGLGELEQILLHLFQHSHKQNFMRVIELESENISKTKEIVSNLKIMAQWPLFGKIEFSSVEGYFQLLGQHHLDSIPLEDNNIWYSDFEFYHQPQKQLRYDNIVAESDSKIFDALAKSLNSDYRKASTYEDLSAYPLDNWVTPDKFTTSGKINLEHALNTLSLSMDTTEVNYGSDKNTGFEQVTFAVEHSKNHHLPINTNNTKAPFLFTVFNSSQYTKERVVEVEIPSWDSNLDLLHVVDSKGREVQFQIENRQEDGTLEVSFLAQLPSLGYMTYRVSKQKEEIILTHKENPRPSYVGGGEMLVLENKFLRCVFSASSMSLLSLIEKETGRELLSTESPGGVFGLVLEEAQSGLSPKAAPAREIILNKEYPVYIKDTFFGGVRCWVDFEIHFQGSVIRSRVILDQDASYLRWETNISWIPQRLEPEGNWKLNFQVPYGYNSDRCRYINPWGVHDSPDGGQVYLTSRGISPLAKEQDLGLALVASGHHSLLCSNGVVTANLLRWDTLPLLPTKDYEFDCGIIITNEDKADLVSTVHKFLHPVYIVENSHHYGNLPASGEVITVGGKGVLSSLWPLEDEEVGMFLRFYNPTDVSQPMTIQTVREMKHVTLVDFHLESYEMLHRSELTKTEFLLPENGIITVRILFN